MATFRCIIPYNDDPATENHIAAAVKACEVRMYCNREAKFATLPRLVLRRLLVRLRIAEDRIEQDEADARG